jgi:WS/DGAT/MGAT family acyltransferase
MPTHHRLTALDSLFLHIEGANTHMHVGALILFDGPPPSYDDFLEYIRRRLSMVPRYRQKLAYPPISQGRPVWIDDPHFNLEYHIRQTGMPAPGDDRQLKRLVGRLMSQQLDRNKPLWEMWVVEGLEGGRFAIVSKTHHCMVDGISGVDLASVILDWSETPTEVPPDDWKPGPPPSRATLLAELAKDTVGNAADIARSVKEAAQHPNELMQKVIEGAGALGSLLGLGMAPASSLNVPIGPHRRFETVRVDLEAVKRIKRALGGTVNDVVLAIVTGALRRLLAARGEELAGRTLRAMIPVSVRADDQRGALGNQVAAMFAPLPIGEDDPKARLALVRSTMKGLKESGQAVGAQLLTKLSNYAPPTILSQAARLQVHTRPFNLVVTNVPGPQVPLYLMGRRMREVYPVVPLADRQALCVGLLSYDGGIGFGLLADYDAMRDVDRFAAGLREAVEEYEAFSRSGAGAPREPAL